MMPLAVVHDWEVEMEVDARKGFQESIGEMFDRAVDRRGFLTVAAALGLTPLLPGLSRAEAKELVMLTWGGDTGNALVEAFLEPFCKEMSLSPGHDGAGTSEGRMKSVLDAGNSPWDVMDAGVGTVQALGAKGYLEEIDYSIVDKSKIIDGFAFKYGVPNYLFSYVIAYDSERTGGRAPTGWADFWNLKDFPGKRGMRKDAQGALEAAVMADGVPIDQVYPIDEKRAWAKLKEIKQDLIFWSFGAESQQLLREGEVTMASMWSTRVNALGQDTNGRCRWVWDQGIVCPGMWAVPRGNPAGKEVFRFLASAQDPDRQIDFFKRVNGGPSNPQASALVPADLVNLDPGHPDNISKQLKVGAEWYGQNQTRIYNEFLDFIAS